MEEKKNYIIKCDECGYEKPFREIETTTKEIKVDNQKMTITYFKCEECGKLYVVELLNFMATKKKEKYLRIMNSLEKKRARGTKISEARLAEAIQVKDDAIAYQKWLIDKYESMIPLDALED